MIWKLSPRVWWGNHLCAQHESAWEVNAVLNVAHNLNDVPYFPLAFPNVVPYFRIARADEEEVDDEYFANLLTIIEMVRRNSWFPLLVHCRAGAHRSPNVAVVAEAIYSGRSHADVHLDARAIRSDIDCGEQVYARTLIERFHAKTYCYWRAYLGHEL